MAGKRRNVQTPELDSILVTRVALSEKLWTSPLEGVAAAARQAPVRA
jgi:hypothetical protein